MDLWQLHIFVSVIEHKSFSKASEAINLSQPTVSTHIKELEEHFKCRLLDRLGKVTEPTRAGLILYDYAKQLLALRDQTQTTMFDYLGQTKGDLVLGGSTIPSGYILPKLMGGFKTKHPDVAISLVTGDTGQITEEVKSGRLELGVVGAKTEDPAIEQTELIKDEMKLIVPRGHAWAGKSSIPCNQIFTQPFIVREKGSGTWRSILKSIDEAGFSPRQLQPAVTMGNSVAVIQGVLAGVGISILSTVAVEEELKTGRLFALHVEGLDLTRFFYLTLSSRRSRSPICDKFLAFTRKQF
jgi:DNA-binding transcriptional LysR family regulator